MALFRFKVTNDPFFCHSVLFDAKNAKNINPTQGDSDIISLFLSVHDGGQQNVNILQHVQSDHFP